VDSTGIQLFLDEVCSNKHSRDTVLRDFDEVVCVDVDDVAWCCVSVRRGGERQPRQSELSPRPLLDLITSFAIVYTSMCLVAAAVCLQDS
jgi:hypothetical protein